MPKILDITFPGPTALVRTVSGATTGTICATGRTVSGTENPFEIYAKIYPPGTTPPGSPIDPSTAKLYAGVVQGKCIPFANPNWRFIREPGGSNNEVPNAVCAAAPPVNNNTLAVWALFSTGWHLEPQDFKGICSNTTDCEGSGSAVLLGGTSQMSTAPAQWQLQVTGSGERGTAQQGPRLGGAWILRHRGGVVWDSGDAGPCRSDLPSWTLIYVAETGVWRLEGNGIATYEREAATWISLGANVLALIACSGEDAGLPATLTVEPAPYA